MEGVISDIRVDRRDRGRVVVFIDGNASFSMAMMSAGRLEKGQILAGEEIAELQERDRLVQAHRLAIRFLGPRLRSCRETLLHLKGKGVATETADQVIGQLSEDGYLDDRRYAAALVAERSRRSPKGAIVLRDELRRRGIDPETAAAVLAGLDELLLARAALEKKMRTLKAYDPKAAFVKAMRFLNGRGFDYHTAKTAFGRWEAEQEGNDDGHHQSDR